MTQGPAKTAFPSLGKVGVPRADNNAGALPASVEFIQSPPNDRHTLSALSMLAAKRTLYVTGEVDEAMARETIAQLKVLENIDPKAQIKMIINTGGGNANDGLAIYDFMREIQCPIMTIGTGRQMSMGSILLAGGDTRTVTQNANIMLHQLLLDLPFDQYSHAEISTASSAQLLGRLKDIYVATTGLNHLFWDIVLERDTYLMPKQAMQLGLIDRVIKNEKPALAFEHAARRPAAQMNSLRKAAMKDIEGLKLPELIFVINSVSAYGSEYAQYRPELVLRLASAEFKGEFWVKNRMDVLRQRNTESLRLIEREYAAAETRKAARKDRKKKTAAKTAVVPR